MKGMIITALMLMVSLTLSAQSHQTSPVLATPHSQGENPQTSDRMAAYREAIGLDMTVPDFETKKIDTKLITICSTTGNYMWLREQK